MFDQSLREWIKYVKFHSCAFHLFEFPIIGKSKQRFEQPRFSVCQTEGSRDAAAYLETFVGKSGCYNTIIISLFQKSKDN